MEMNLELAAYIDRIANQNNMDVFTPAVALQVGIYNRLGQLVEEIQGLRADLEPEVVPVAVTDALGAGEEPTPGPPAGTTDGSLAGPAGKPEEKAD